jgi:hypothetical protein
MEDDGNWSVFRRKRHIMERWNGTRISLRQLSGEVRQFISEILRFLKRTLAPNGIAINQNTYTRSSSTHVALNDAFGGARKEFWGYLSSLKFEK